MRALWLVLVLAGCAGAPLFTVYRDTAVPIAAQTGFEADRYLGLWYEIARFPVFFEAGCEGVTAEYSARDDGLIGVFNTCRGPDGAVTSTIAGTAEVVGDGQLKVRFGSVPFVAADYWVLWVDEGYRTAVVGAPNGRSGWVLAREPAISEARLAAAQAVLAANGYDVRRMEMVAQRGGAPG